MGLERALARAWHHHNHIFFDAAEREEASAAEIAHTLAARACVLRPAAPGCERPAKCMMLFSCAPELSCAVAMHAHALLVCVRVMQSACARKKREAKLSLSIFARYRERRSLPRLLPPFSFV